MRASTLRRSPQQWGVLVGSVAVTLAACGVGERPVLAEPGLVTGSAGTPTGFAPADDVLALLEAELPEQLTATYSITTKLGGTTRPATVVRSGDDLSVTIGDIRFLTDGTDQTCNLATNTCEPGVQEARVSDAGVTSMFYAASPAQTLRVAVARATGEPVASNETVAGRFATCVRVPSGQGDELTCAAPDGLVALWDTAAVSVRLDSIAPTADPAAFGTSR